MFIYVQCISTRKPTGKVRDALRTIYYYTSTVRPRSSGCVCVSRRSQPSVERPHQPSLERVPSSSPQGARPKLLDRPALVQRRVVVFGRRRDVPPAAPRRALLALALGRLRLLRVSRRRAPPAVGRVRAGDAVVPLAALNGWGAGKRGAEWSRYDSRAEQCEGERAKEGRSEQRKDGVSKGRTE